MQAAADFCSVTAVQRFCQGFGDNQAFRHSLAHCPPCVNGHRVRHRHGIRQRAAACSTGNQHSQKVSRCYCLIRVKAAIRNPFRWDQVILRGALYGSGIRFMPDNIAVQVIVHIDGKQFKRLDCQFQRFGTSQRIVGAGGIVIGKGIAFRRRIAQSAGASSGTNGGVGVHSGASVTISPSASPRAWATKPAIL